MRLTLVAFLLGIALPARAQSIIQVEKQKKIDAAKMENCPRLKAYFERRTHQCPKAAAKAQHVQCTGPADNDTLNALIRPCSVEVDALPPEPAAPEEPPLCRAADDKGETLAELPEADPTACRKKLKHALLEKCDKTTKKIVAEVQRKGRKPSDVTVKCPRVK